MSETSASLLERLILVRPDAAEWQRFVELYTPLIRNWLRRQALLHQDADDLVQEVLAVVVRRLPDFRKEPRTGAFRRWLRTITVNCLRDFWRSRRKKPPGTGDSDFLQVLDQLEDPASGLSQQWDQDHDRHVLRQLLEWLKPEFKESTWLAFQRVALDGATPEQVATELGLTVNAVCIAKFRVLSRLRQEGKDLID